jgi:hypothetical protein
MFKLAKDSAVKARTQAINQLKAVLVIADPALRERLSSLGNRELFRTCAGLSLRDGEGDEDAVAQATRITLSLLAQRGACAQWCRTAAVRTSPPRGPQSVTLERPRPGSTGC